MSARHLAFLLSLQKSYVPQKYGPYRQGLYSLVDCGRLGGWLIVCFLLVKARLSFTHSFLFIWLWSGLSGISRWGMWTVQLWHEAPGHAVSVVAEHRLSCSEACGITVR